MTVLQYRAYLRQSIQYLEGYCQDFYRCYSFRSAYMCRKFLDDSGLSDVLAVRIVSGCYLPMPRELYRDWRRLQRQLAELEDKYDLI